MKFLTLTQQTQLSFRPKKSLEDMMGDSPKDAIDLCKRLLHFNPDKRITADEALRHPYVSRFHNPKEEISLNYDVVPPLSDSEQLSVDEYRTKLYEVCIYHALVTVWCG